MKIVKPSAFIMSPLPDGMDAAKYIERVGRTCYKSEDKITESSAETYVRQIVHNGHEAMLEHLSVTVKFICSRGVGNEIVRHRIASFGQESTRYCNYSKTERFENKITAIWPVHTFGDPGDDQADFMRVISQNEDAKIWYNHMVACEKAYDALVENDLRPEIARDVLPLGLKTELVMTANIREWRHFFNLRLLGTTGRPHPEIKYLAGMVFDKFVEHYHPMFEDLYILLNMNDPNRKAKEASNWR